jgi:hypothetical protein
VSNALKIAAGMVGASSGPVDPYFANVVALLHCDGADGGTTFTDEKGGTYTAGPGVTTTTEAAKFGGTGAYFQGGYIDRANWAGLTIDPNGHTIELWARPGSGIRCFMDCRTGADAAGWSLYSNSSDNLLMQTSSGFVMSAASTYDPTIMQHIAFCVDATSNRLYCNGVRIAEGGGITHQTVVNGLRISGQLNGAYKIDGGYMDEIRITKGVARYTGATYTVPTEAFPDQ